MGPSKKIRLERSEVIFFLVVVLLSHGLLFFMGIFTGLKMQPAQSHKAGEHVASHDSAHANRDPAGHSEAAKAELAKKTAPASEEEGATLKKAYRQSKQQAFVDLILNKEVSDKPESVAAAEAHFNATSEWERKPAAIDETMQNASDASAVVEAKNPSAVKKLFERKPSSLDNFKPIPGTFTLQVGSYASPEEAQAKIRELRERGFNDAYVVSVKKSGGDWHRVQFGSFPSADWAKKAGEKIVKFQLAHGFLVQKIQ